MRKHTTAPTVTNPNRLRLSEAIKVLHAAGHPVTMHHLRQVVRGFPHELGAWQANPVRKGGRDGWVYVDREKILKYPWGKQPLHE